jgi:hypothetical protein
MQLPPSHTPLSQSRPTLQPPSGPQGAHSLPPQSTSVSLPFCTLSSQRAGAHTESTQEPLSQSGPSPQASPLPHGVSQDPPQSMAVSLPFFKLSVQEAPLQVEELALQLPLKQSLSAEQSSAGPHFGHSSPPQSTSDSMPFRV